MTQFQQKVLEAQEQHKGKIVAVRLGDFYEVIGDDAVLVGGMLDLTITGRLWGENRVAMVGFPYHCKDEYIDKIKQATGRDVVEVEV